MDETQNDDRSGPGRGAGQVREAHRFDEAGLLAWMESEVAHFSGPLRVEQFKGGQSNPTYRLVTPGRSYVLRRKPPGPLLPGAHAVDREYRVMESLAQTGFPVASVHGLCMDPEIIGTPFYIMDMVEGRIFWDSAFPGIPGEERAACFDSMNAVLARLHLIDPAEAGLSDFGRAGNYFERQIARWSRQYVDDEAAGRVESMDRLVEWLPAHVPPGDAVPRILHGDYRCDNMIFHSDRPEVAAVIDWELSTLGDPLADFSYHLMMYRLPDALGSRDLAALNIPSEADYVRAYCRRTGRDDIQHLDFYLAFNLFRLAAIVHGIKGRLIRGNAASAQAARMIERLEPLAELGWKQAERASAP